MAISNLETKSEVESVKCYSCGFTEDCTLPYIYHIRDTYDGRWICGLCVEAVKDELLRSHTKISNQEALDRHVSFCKKFQKFDEKTEHPISAMAKVLLKRGFSEDSPRSVPVMRPARVAGVDELLLFHLPLEESTMQQARS